MFRVGKSEKSRERRKVFASHPEHYSGGKSHNSPLLLSHVCPAAACFDGYVSCDLLRFGCILSDSVKCKGTPCVQRVSNMPSKTARNRKSPVPRPIRGTGPSYVVDF